MSSRLAMVQCLRGPAGGDTRQQRYVHNSVSRESRVDRPLQLGRPAVSEALEDTFGGLPENLLLVRCLR